MKKHRYAWGYVKDYLNPIVEDDKIIIPVGEEETVAVLTKVRNMLVKYKFTEAEAIARTIGNTSRAVFIVFNGTSVA